MTARIFSIILLILMASVNFSLGAQPNINFNLESVRDPFIIPAVVEEIEEKDEDFLKRLPFTIEVKGIVVDKTAKFAIINDRIVKEKDNWEGLVIDEIEKEYLIVIYGHRKIKVPFQKEETQK